VEAFVICTECAVRDACLTFGLDHPELIGVWAATTDRDRVRLRRARRQADARQSAPDEEPGSA
jgi:hypothetical protein